MDNTLYLTAVIIILLHASMLQSKNVLYVIPKGKKCAQLEAKVTCGTLESYTNNYNNNIINNTEIVFFPGTHQLNSTLYIENKRNINLRGVNGTAIIQCSEHQSVSLHIEYSSYISISDIAIVGCGRHGVNDTENISLPSDSISFEKCTLNKIDKSKIYAAIFFDHVQNISMSQVTVSDTHGYGVYLYSCWGHILIESSSFWANKGGKSYNGGNFHVVLWKYCSHDQAGTNLTISGSDFVDGKTNLIFSLHKAISASGIHICSFCPTALISIDNCNISRNHGGNIYIFMQNSVEYFWRVFIGNTNITEGVAYEGAGIQFASRLHLSDYKKCNETQTNWNYFKMYKVLFSRNSATYSGGATKIQLTESDCKPSRIHFKESHFINNFISSHFSSGAAVRVMKHQIPKFKLFQLPQKELVFKKVTFQSHHKHTQWYHSIVKVENFDNIQFEDCDFLDNQGTALALKTSSIKFVGTINFENNEALNGGAISLCDSSSFFINPNTAITFRDNHAKNTGGAIYVQTSCIGQYEPCFFQPNLNNLTLIGALNTTYNMSLKFVNNSAGIAGNSIYGGNIERCLTYTIFTYDNIQKGFNYSLLIAQSIFHFNTSVLSEHISSDAFKVMLCGQNETPTYTYPGKVFSVSVRSVGQLDGPSSGVVTATLNNTSNETSLTPAGYYNPTTRCSILSMIVNSSARYKHYSVELKVQQNKPELIYRYRMNQYLDIIIMPCPWGFRLNKNSGICDCYSTRTRIPIDCYLDDLVIRKDPSIWIGCKSGNDCVTSSLLYGHCGLASYCNQHINVSADNTQLQCKTGRTGIACGSCRKNYSAIFGSSNCKQCTNSYLSLLPLYLIAPIILFIIISKLDITIANGSIYGFLFYMGFLEVYRNLFEPKSNALSKYYLGVSYIVSWLNLNVGIEVCFFNGMTTYHKIWLEFSFIFYVWILEVLIVYLCRRYTNFTRICGSNISKVLSTVLYMTILKCSILTCKCFLFAHIVNVDKKKPMIVWAPQTDIPYLSAYHSPLLVVATVLLGIIFVFCGSLLFIQFLRRNSRLRILKRMLPFFETFNGPCNDTHAFWPGLMLFVQGLSHLFINVFIFTEDLVFLIQGLVSIFLIVLSFLGPRGVYKIWSLNILELAYMTNILILTIIMHIQNLRGFKANNVIFFSSINFTLLCFILYHFKTKVKLFVLILLRSVWTTVNKIWQMISRCRKDRVHILLDVSNSIGTTEPSEDSPLLS